MIKIEFIHKDWEYLETMGFANRLIKVFHSFDEFLYWYFHEDGDIWHIGEVLEGQEIITGEIQDKGINNK